MSQTIIIGLGLLGLGLVVLLSLRLRLRCHLCQSSKKLFIGLGRTGAELDFVASRGHLHLFGYSLKSIPLSGITARKKKAKADPDKKIEKKPAEKRDRPLGKIIEAVRLSLKPIFQWIVGLFRAIRIEQMEGRLAGGFDSPDQTGQVYGLYCALIGAVPALEGRLNYEPNWQEASFEADFKAAVALPLYALVGQSIALVLRLPLIRIVKVAIGNRKERGDQDVQ